MEAWDEIYRRYISVMPHRAIFQQEGFVEGTIYDKSSYFYKYFINDTVDYVGVGNRRRGKPNKEIINHSFSDFIKIINYNASLTHRVIIKNVHAEYKSASKYDREQPVIDEYAWRVSKEWTLRHFGPGKMMGSKTVDFETAWMEMDKQTSAGWPHNLVHHNKAELFKDKKTSRYSRLLLRDDR